MSTINSQQPNTITTPDGSEITKTTTAQGSIVGDGTYDRVLTGFQKNGFGSDDFGIKVSQAGNDVKTAPDSKLIMSSAFNSFKIIATGTASITVAASTGLGTAQIAHGLSTAPCHLVYLQMSSTSYLLPFLDVNAGSGVIGQHIYAACDATYLYIQVLIPTSSPSYGSTFGPASFRYYIIVDTASAS